VTPGGVVCGDGVVVEFARSEEFASGEGVVVEKTRSEAFPSGDGVVVEFARSEAAATAKRRHTAKRDICTLTNSKMRREEREHPTQLWRGAHQSTGNTSQNP